jgi:serine protease Do
MVRTKFLSLVTAGLLGATVLTGAVILSPTPAVQAAQIMPLDLSKSLSPLVEKVMPSVVSVEVKFSNAAAVAGDGQDAGPDQMPPGLQDFFNQFPQFKNRNPQAPEGGGGGVALGSGFVISTDGYVVTNNHVVKDADTVAVTFQSGDKFDAKVIGTDPKTDLALLKIKSDNAFPAVNFATVDAKVGDYVMAVGNPFGLGGTVTSGIISARGRDIGSGPYDDYLQIDASINKGNSGGPTFSLDGQVIGINTAIYSPSGGSVGIGFAIPASVASKVIESLKVDHKVTRGFLGIKYQPITPDIAETLGLENSKGALISDLTVNSPAKKAGLKSGDTIITVDGSEISESHDLARIIAKVPPGKKVELGIVRSGKRQIVSVTLAAMPSDKDMATATPAVTTETTGLAAYGIEVAPSEDGAGLKVTKVISNSFAASHGLNEGDVILEVAGVVVKDENALEKALKQSSNKKVLVLVKNSDGQKFLAMPLMKS